MDSVAASRGDRYPIREIFFGCCARAAGVVVSKKVASSQRKFFLLLILAPIFASSLVPHGSRLFDHLVSPCEHLRWNRQSNLFRGLQVDDKLKLCRLLHW